jgi:restriction endonuclease S subunit
MKRKLADCLIEVTKGVGADWHKYRVLGATRNGLALAKERVGKAPERYKFVAPGTVFYNPMRIMIGSIAMLDDDQEPGITSPDYVVLRTREGILHPRWFYYWLRSTSGEELIRSLARGAVRERMMFSRLEVGEIDLPSWEDQLRGAQQLAEVARARAAVKAQLMAAQKLPAAMLRAAFRPKISNGWTFQPLGELCELLPSKSISTGGDAEVQAITTACLTEAGFQSEGIKSSRMWAHDAAECRVRSGEILIARSNTSELVGRVSIYQGAPPGVVASDLTIRIWPSAALIPEFLCHFLSFLFVEGFWRERAGGASGSMKKIRRSQIEELPVPVAPTGQQRYLARNLTQELESSLSLTEALQARWRLISSLPGILLDEGFRSAN